MSHPFDAHAFSSSSSYDSDVYELMTIMIISMAKMTTSLMMMTILMMMMTSINDEIVGDDDRIMVIATMNMMVFMMIMVLKNDDDFDCGRPQWPVPLHLAALSGYNHLRLKL